MSTTLDYTPKLYQDICEDYADYHQTGYTVCGAQDPAIIHLGEGFGKKYPELKDFTVVRVIDKYLNPWNSATLLEFSNREIDEDEYEDYENLMGRDD